LMCGRYQRSFVG